MELSLSQLSDPPVIDPTQSKNGQQSSNFDDGTCGSNSSSSKGDMPKSSMSELRMAYDELHSLKPLLFMSLEELQAGIDKWEEQQKAEQEKTKMENARFSDNSHNIISLCHPSTIWHHLLSRGPHELQVRLQRRFVT